MVRQQALRRWLQLPTFSAAVAAARRGGHGAERGRRNPGAGRRGPSRCAGALCRAALFAGALWPAAEQQQRERPRRPARPAAPRWRKIILQTTDYLLWTVWEKSLGSEHIFILSFSSKDMEENESNQPLMTSSQYPKEVVRKRENSVRNSGGSDSSRFSRKSFKLDYRLEEDVTKSKKGKDGRFVNPWPTWKNPSIPNALRWMIMEKDNSNVPRSKEELDKELPVLKPYFISDPEEAGVKEAGLRVTWLGHATVMVEMDELIFLTDPIFSHRASPSQYVGPKRFRRPPCTISELPPIDAVLISHNHYDHLDYNSVIALNERFGNELRWFVPLGLLDWMQKCGCENVIELDWWEENCVPRHDKVTFVFTPSQHWCKRTLMDDNKVLWGSWSVLGPWNRFFFTGDTGYCPAFEEIGKRFGPFDLAAIPVGAYEPRWFMKWQHIDPEEAVRIHIDVQAKKSVAIHWGTFVLTNEHYLDPPVKLREALGRYGLTTEDFFVLKHGESRYLNSDDKNVEDI